MPNEIDINKLNPQERQLFNKYGKLPSRPFLKIKQQKDRKYFDSGDYALSKAGRAPQSTVGTAIPNPENIPHASPVPVSYSPHISVQISPVNSPTSPAKESSLSQESTLADIMSADNSTSDTIFGTDSTVVEEVVEPANSPGLLTRNARDIESTIAEPGFRDSDIRMD